MSSTADASKYAHLPDIDTGPEVYATDDNIPDPVAGASADDDEYVLLGRNTGGAGRRTGDKEEIDTSNLMSTEEASQLFRKAEKKLERQRRMYAYPPSPTSAILDERDPSIRLASLQAELEALEADLSDPTNPVLHHGSDGGPGADPGDLMRGLMDIRGRLEHVKKSRDRRTKLLATATSRETTKPGSLTAGLSEAAVQNFRDSQETASLGEMDQRVAELEDLIGSSTMTIDETSMLPAPLLPTLTKLTAQLAVLTQPRHLDSISRRLKALLLEIERLPSSHNQAANKKQPATGAQANSLPSNPAPAGIQEQLLPLLTRLAPNMPHIPHILARLRTLSTLHTSAAEFQSTLENLEAEQSRVRSALGELTRAVDGVEKSLDENSSVMEKNILGLEERITSLSERLDAVTVKGE